MMTRPRWSGLLALAGLISLPLLFLWKILFTNLILVGVDTFLYFYPYKAYAAEALRQGRLPLWNPHLFMGAPLLANSQVGLFYPLNWLFLWLDPPRQVAWSIGLHLVLAGLLMLVLARLALRLGWTASLAAAILFACGGYLGAQVEHINQLNAAAWLPLLFLLYHLGLQRAHRRLWFWLLALLIGVTLLAGHAQTVFITLFGLGLYGLWQGGSEQIDQLLANRPLQIHQIRFQVDRFSLRRWTAAGRSLALSLLHVLWPLALAVVLAVALAAVQLVPTAELSALSIRSGGLSFRDVVSFSLRPGLLHYSLLPPLGLDLSQVFGDAFSEWVAYLGVTGLLLALLGGVVSIWRSPARPFVFVAGSGLVLSLGIFSGPLYLVLYYLVPGFNLFRVPARWLLLYAFGMAVLAGVGVEALGQPAQLRLYLAIAWRWLRARAWRLALGGGLPLLWLLALLINNPPPLITLAAWLMLSLLALGLIGSTLRASAFTQAAPGAPDKRPAQAPRSLIQALGCKFYSSGWPAALILMLLIFELFWAAQSLNYNQPTAPQAYSLLRNAVAFLLAADPPETGQGPPGRFLSLSGITYDPGDLQELQQIYGDQLSAKALYELVVAAKAKEVLFYNLPMLYGLHSVDGYDGGILPLARFVTLERLFLPADELSLDGRLREKLRYVPPGRLLSLLNTRWVITDKVFDVWIDHIFYDLQFPARLTPGQAVTTTDLPGFPTTAIGLVSHLEGAASLPAQSQVANLVLSFADGGQEIFTFKAGVDTAEGSYPANAAHPQARIGVAWPYQGAGVDYITVYTLTNRSPLTGLSVTATLPAGRFVLRGLSLINQPTTTGRSVLLSTEGDYRQVYSGDVKIYENRAVLPRAFVVHQALVAPDIEAAIAAMQAPTFDPASALVRLAQGQEAAGRLAAGQPAAQDRVTITRYEPERVEVALALGSPGWLVLTDAYYPGWQASLDGQPADILPADLMFRAVAVPAGEHTLLFEFKPRSVQIGFMVSGLALLLWLVGLGLVLERRRKR